MYSFILITSILLWTPWISVSPVAAHPQITPQPIPKRAAGAESEVGYFSSGQSYYISACGSDSTWMVTSASATPSPGGSVDSYGGCCPSGTPCTRIGYFCYNANTVMFWEEKGSSVWYCAGPPHHPTSYTDHPLTHSSNSQGSSVCDINTVYDSENGDKVATYYHCGTTDRRSLYQTIGAAGAVVPIASTTVFVDPASNQANMNSADSSGTSRLQSSPASSDSSSSSSNNAATVGGAVGGGIGGLIIICLLSYLLLQKRKQKTTMPTNTIADGSTNHFLKPELAAVEGSGTRREELDVVPYAGIKAQEHTATVRELELDGVQRQRQKDTPAELVAGEDSRPLGKPAELGGQSDS